MLSTANQAFVLQSSDRTWERTPCGQVMLVSDRFYRCRGGEAREVLAVPLGIAQKLYRVTTLELQILPDCEKA